MASSPSTPTSAFEVQNLSYAYAGQIPALDRVSLNIHTGERLAVLGSNGSGKSTLLKILDGLYFPTGGSVTAFGRPLTEQALRDDAYNFAFRSRVGFVFQDSDAQLFMPTVWEEVTFAPLQLGIPPDEVQPRALEALQALRIEKIKDRAPHQLSGGEKKRVALASILSLMPEVWLLDEPTAGLDPRSVSWLLSFLNGQAAQGKTVVLATHDLSILAQISDRAYVLDETHRVAGEGAPACILQDTALLASANLIRTE